jgi:hypothetical protein
MPTTEHSPESRRRDLLALGSLSLLTTVSVLARWQYDNWLAGFDMMTYFLPSYEYLGLRIRDFEIPAWNPHLSSGYPAAADPGAGWLYLPVMIGMFLAAAGTGIKIMVLLQAWLCAFGTWGFLRCSGIRPWIAFVIAGAYATGAPLADATGQSTVIGQMSAWIPIAMLGVEMAWQSRDRLRRTSWSALAGLALIQVFLSWPQGFMYSAILTAGWLGYRCLLDRDPHGRPLRQRLTDAVASGTVITATTIFWGLGGILPRLEFIHASSIPGGDYSKAIGGNYVEWRHTWTQVLSNLLTDGVYWRIMLQSSAVVVLAFLGILTWRRGIGTPYFAFVTLVCIDLAVDPSLTRWAFYLIPPFEQIHHHRPTATMYVVFFPISVLAATGLQGALDRPRRTRRASIAALATGAVLGIAALWGEGVGIMQPLVAVLIIAALVVLPRWRPRFVLPAIAAIVLIWPNAWDIGATIVHPADFPEYDDSFGTDPETRHVLDTFMTADAIGTETAAGFLQERWQADGPFRYATLLRFGEDSQAWNSSAYRMYPAALHGLVNGRSVFLGLHDVTGYNPVHLGDYVTYVDVMNNGPQNYHWLDLRLYPFSDSQLLDMLNVRYFILDLTYPTDSLEYTTFTASFPEVFRDDAVAIFENPFAYPRAWIVHDVQPETFESLGDLSLGYAIGYDTAFIGGDEMPPTTPGDPNADDIVTLTGYAPESMTIDVVANGDGLLVIGDVWEKNWAAYVDGERVEILRTNHALRGVPVSSGTHTIELRYEPTLLHIGMWSTGITSVLLTGLWVWLAIDNLRSLRAGRESSGARDRRHRHLPSSGPPP